MSYNQFLVSDTIITLPAKFGDGTEGDTYWKKCAHLDFERWRLAEQSDHFGQIERAKQKLIASCLVNADGTRALTDAESIKLTAEGVNILFPLALEASGIAKRPDAGNASGGEASNTSSESSP